MGYRTKIYITADWEEDQSAVNQFYQWKNEQKWNCDLWDDSKLVESWEGSWACEVKTSLKNQIDASDVFVLMVGTDTASVRDGSCLLCENYRSFSGNCANGHTTDKRSFIEFACERAVEGKKNIVVLYQDRTADRSKCPLVLRDRGTHVAMLDENMDGKKVWDFVGGI